MFFKKDISKLSDTALLQNYRHDGKPEWLGELYKRYSHLVYGICLKYLQDKDEAADATLAIFEKLLDSLLVQDVFAFQAWLHRVAKNHCLTVLKLEKRTAKKHEAYMYVVGDNIMDDTEDILLAEWKEKEIGKLEKAIENLAEEQKHCVTLFYLHNKSYKEITDTTGYSLGEVKSYIQNGKRNLHSQLTGTE